MNLTTCYITTADYHSIAYYSHLIPVAVAILLAIFVLIKSNFSFLSKLFLSFVVFFCLWLIGDVITWTSNNYNLVVASWASLDYINILFYLAAGYFFAVLARNRDIETWQKILILLLSIPGWWIAATGQSIEGLDQPNCEAFNSQWLINYKFIIETIVLGFIMIYGFFSAVKFKERRSQIILVAIALCMFLIAFMSTEYIAGQTGIYEINLYSLFVLPVFLAMIIFSITNLRIFAFRTLGTQLLIYVLLIMVGSQFFFLQDATYRALTLVTFALSLFLGIVLVRNIRKEEELSMALEVANEGQAQLIHFINHQIKGYLGKARIIFSELLTGQEYAPITEPTKKMLVTGESDIKEGVDFVQQILRASDIEKGTFAYDMQPLDISEVVKSEGEGKRALAEDKGLKYEIEIKDGDYHTKADVNQIREAVKNLIDNSINYTPKGSINVQLTRPPDRDGQAINNNKILLKIDDTGIGLSDEVKSKLFTKGGRDKDSMRVNVNSTGFGLSIVKNIALAHKGRVWADSAGPGKGSTFYMELPVV